MHFGDFCFPAAHETHHAYLPCAHRPRHGNCFLLAAFLHMLNPGDTVSLLQMAGSYFAREGSYLKQLSQVSPNTF